jgi:hypothetical protein
MSTSKKQTGAQISTNVGVWATPEKVSKVMWLKNFARWELLNRLTEVLVY